ncbi:Kp4-domain-containing protein [Fusarium oxysporum]|nr:Kp4-domain-containing protein [Fusarium oxysporum]
MQITAIIATALLAAGQAAAGINCRGSSQCTGGLSGAYLSSLINLASYIDQNRWYKNGEHIVCADRLCAFLQNTGGMPGSSIKNLLKELDKHGCNKCGSVPVFFPEDNNEKSHVGLSVNNKMYGIVQVVFEAFATVFRGFLV